jgi:hypothetical protein
MLTCKLEVIVGNSIFVLDNHIQLDLYSTISLKQQSECRYVIHKASHRENQSLLLLLNDACLAAKRKYQFLLLLVLTERGSNSRSIASKRTH